MSQFPLIFIIAGEASGDQLGAELMTSLKETHQVRFAGIGGEAMAAEGLKSLFPMQELSLMGIVSILQDLPNLLRRLRFTVDTIKELKPDVVITIDAPEFSLRVMKRLHKMGERPRLIHYVAPTVWAWRPGLAKKISKFLDGLLCIYPFEPPYFEKYGLKTVFVGHPVTRNKNLLMNSQMRNPHLLCVLPGSRCSEVTTLLPIFKETVLRLKNEIPELKVVVPTIPSVEALVRRSIRDWPVDVEVVLGGDARNEAFCSASVALAASGTVALQLSVARIPFVIAYKVNKINAWIAKFMLKTPWVCMVNILLAFHKFGFLKKDMSEWVPISWIPEFIQKDCTPEKITPAVLCLLKDEEARVQQIKAMEEAVSLLKASDNIAAKTVSGFLRTA